MNEYNYEIDKYLIGVDSNGEDRIGLTIATIKDNKLCILGSFYGDNARFIDLLIKQNQKYKEKINGVYEERTYLYNKLSVENEQLNILVNSCQEEIRRLKKQLEEYKRLGFKHLNDKCNKLENQQKEFIKYLEYGIKSCELVCDLTFNHNKEMKIYKEVLSKYKEIIGA